MQKAVIQTTLIGSMLVAIIISAAALPETGIWPAPFGILAALAILLQVGAVILRALNWNRLVSEIRPVPTSYGIAATLIGMAANSLLPFRLGEIVRAYLMGHALGVSRLAVFASVLLERLFDSVFLSLLFGLTGFAFDVMGLPGGNWLFIGMLMSTSAAIVMLLLLFLLGSRNMRVLSSVGAATAIFNDDSRDRMRIGFWSASHFLRLLRAQPRVVFRFAAGLALVWLTQLLALLLLLRALRPPHDLIVEFGQALSAYLAVSLPSAPASIGSFQAIFVLFSAKIGAAMGVTGYVVFWVWALMMVPITVSGLLIFLFQPRFGTRRLVKHGDGQYGQLLRDRPRAREMSDILASHFRGIGTVHAAVDLDLTGSGHLRRQFKGGSDQLTILVEQSDSEIVRKLAPASRVDKLQGQRDWLKRHESSGLFPTVLDWRVAGGYAMLDMELFSNSTPFFNYLHGVDPAAVAAVLIDFLGVMETEIYQAKPLIRDEKAIVSYIKDKVQKKLIETTAQQPSLTALFAADQITVNGQKINGLAQSIDCILKNDAIMAELSEYRPADIHGDMTVDNLLMADGRLRLIDPNNENAITDPIVDFAKLAQSFHSGYEFLTHVTAIETGPADIRFPDMRSAAYEAIWRHLDAHFKVTLPPALYRSLRFHEAVHFTRMLPYRSHIRPQTTAMFYGIAALRMQEFLDQYQ